MKRRLGVAAVLLCLSTIAQTGVADAADLKMAYVHNRAGDGEVRATASYRDSTDKFCAQDRYTDDHSGVVQYKRRSQSGWTNAFEKWDYGTNDGVPACVVAAYAENTPLVMRACVGEYADNPRHRRILWCGTPKSFRA